MEPLERLDPLTEAQQELYDWLTEYINEHQHSPSIRQMMRAMDLRSPAPVQSRLDHLKKKGYIAWEEGQARTIRLLHARPKGIPVVGAIAATSLVETFNDTEVEHLDFSNIMMKPGHFALKVRGHSMIDALIDDGDIVIMQPVTDPKTIKNDTIVAARVESKITLKYYQKKGKKVILMPGNPDRETYPITEVNASDVEIEGVLVAVWRSCK
ncbi:transcriptional repressor LexA [Alkalinema pantanalense CENA528]|uniref:transcriptional repressor LexA n=1 Tax=Alkalinema pantanalense TaxID=1620705 RepID=UPI003D6E56F1